MTAFSPISAALEGLRVMRREPKAVLYWIAVWALALAAIGAIKALGGGPAAAPGGRDALSLIRSYGPLATVLAPMLVALSIMNTATVYRAVLRPGEHGWHLFKLGADEARIAVLSLVGAILLIVANVLLWFFLEGPAGVLFALFGPISTVVPAVNLIIAGLGAAATVFLEIWVGVRLSLAPVQTFAERGFPIDSYWDLTRGNFWRLYAAYLLVVCEIALFFLLLGILGLVLAPLSMLVLHWRGPVLARRVLILTILVPLAAFSSGLLFVVPSVLIGGCRAFAYRAIAGARTAPVGQG